MCVFLRKLEPFLSETRETNNGRLTLQYRIDYNASMH